MFVFKRFPVSLLLSLAVAAPASLAAQDAAAEFSQAREFGRETSGQVRNTRLELTWTGPDTAWYARQLPDKGREYVRVDAAAGKREPLFDHAALARALGNALKEKTDPKHLDMKRLQVLPDGVLKFRAGNKTWGWRASDQALRPWQGEDKDNGGLLAVSALPKTSRNGGDQAGFTVVNKTSGTLEIFWVNMQGRRQSYGRIPPGKPVSLGSTEGHLWHLTDADGKTLGGFVAGETETIEVTGPAPEPKSAPPAQDKGREGGRQRQRGDGASPDGKWTAFLREGNVWARPAGGGAETALSTDGKPDDAYQQPLLWSPDSRFLMVQRVRPGQSHTVTMVQSSPEDQVEPKVLTHNYLKPGDRLPVARPQIFEPATGKSAPVDPALFDNPWSINGFHWSPDSRELTFVYNQRGHQILRVVGIEAATGKTRAVVEEKPRTFVDYSGKFFLRHLDATREIVWMSERDGWNHLYLVDAVTGAIKRQLTQGTWAVHEVDSVDEAGRTVTFRRGGHLPGQDPYHVHYARVSLDTGVITPLTEGDGTHEVTYSPDGKWLVDKWSRVDLAPVTEIRRVSDGKLSCELERADWTDLLAAGWRAPERFSAKGRDGVTDIYGYLIRPSKFDPKKRYPVIENIYAGPHDAHVEKAFFTGGHMREMAEAGFLIVRIDGMGTSLRSKAFHDVAWKNLQDAGFPDRIAWMKAAATTRPEMDLTRVGIYGGSAGGQNAMRAVLDHADFYKAAAADCGCHDNRMDKIWWNEQWMGWPVDDSYLRASNVVDAGKLGGRLLLTVGETDHNVDPASTTQVVNALIKANKDFEYIVFPGKDHGACESDYGRRRRMDFFLRHLGRPAAKG